MSVYPIFYVTISMLFWSVEKYSLKHYAYLKYYTSLKLQGCFA